MNYVPIRRALVSAGKKALFAEFPTSEIIVSHSNPDQLSELPESYGVINILSISSTGKTAISTGANEDSQVSLQAHYEIQAQFSFIGSQSADMAFCFYHNISANPVVFEELYKSKIAYLRKSDVRRAPQRRETQWVEAFNVDATFNFIVNYQQVVDTVDAVILQDTISGEIYTVPPNIVIP